VKGVPQDCPISIPETTSTSWCGNDEGFQKFEIWDGSDSSIRRDFGVELASRHGNSILGKGDNPSLILSSRRESFMGK